MTLNDLFNVIVVPTRKTAQSETLLDPIVVYDSIKVFAFGTIDVDDWVSDHAATYVRGWLGGAMVLGKLPVLRRQECWVF